MSITTDDSATVSISTVLTDGASGAGGWNKAQLALIGVAWPPVKGWASAMHKAGFRVSRQTYEQFVALKESTKLQQKLKRKMNAGLGRATEHRGAHG